VATGAEATIDPADDIFAELERARADAAAGGQHQDLVEAGGVLSGRDLTGVSAATPL
jgi:hypothetical protein